MCNLLICVVLFQLMQNIRGETALFAACQEGRYDPAALLINHGADVNYLSKVRPLHVHGQHGRIVCSVQSKVGLLYNYPLRMRKVVKQSVELSSSSSSSVVVSIKLPYLDT